MRSRKLASVFAAVVGIVAMAWAPSAASAESYAPGANAQNFQTGDGGWTGTAQYTGLCIPLLTCPSLSSNFVATGGTGGAGDGYISSSLTGLLSTEAATSSLLQESPAFIYNGNGGQVPATATFDLARLPNLAALLGVDVLNDATFKADLVDQSNSAVVNVLPATHDPENDGVWAAMPTQSVNPNLLVIGHAYKIRITTTYHTAAVLIPSGGIGFDNVALNTLGVAGGGGNNTNNIGGSSLTSAQLNALILSSGMRSVGVLRGNVFRFRVKCPIQAAPERCLFAVQGLSKGKGSASATATGKANMKANAARILKIKVKPKFLALYQQKNKITVKAKVRVGNISTTAYKRVRLIHQKQK